MKRMLNRRTIRFFFFCLICLLFISSALVTGIFVRQARNERTQYEASLSDELQKTASYFIPGLTAAVNSGNAIFLTRWFQHFRNSSGIYDAEFNPIRRLEIQQELMSKVASLEFVTDILVITPHKDSIISKNGWNTMERYNQIFSDEKIVLSRENSGAPAVEVLDRDVCVIQLDDVDMRRDKGIVCMLLSRRLLTDTMKRVLPQSAGFVSAKLCGETVWEWGASESSDLTETSTIHNPSFSLTMSFESYETSQMDGLVCFYGLLWVSALLFNILLAAVITFISAKPLHQLLCRLGGEGYAKAADPYQFLSEYVETFSAENQQLNREKDDLNASIWQFMSRMKNEILFGMLTNPDFDFQNEYICSYIPWIHEGYPFVMAILEPRPGTEEFDPSLLSGISPAAYRVKQFFSFTVLQKDVCLLFWFDDLSSAGENIGGVSEALSEVFHPAYYACVSEVLREPDEMRDSYLMLKAELDHQKKATSELPISLQIKLVGKLQANKPEECEVLLEESRELYGPDAFWPLLVRVAEEYGFDAARCEKAGKSASLEERWQMVRGLSADLCMGISHFKKTGIGESGKALEAYVRENCCDPEMCVKLLADRFAMHRTLISKILKAYTGQSFSDYLLELRMGRAEEMLCETGESIAGISEKVGYSNYATFKRAFIRFKGITPREFRERQAGIGMRRHPWEKGDV